MRKYILIIALFAGSVNCLQGQELEARITVNAQRVSTQVDRKIFQTLQNSLNTFLKNRRWTNDKYQANEKIVCNFFLNISEVVDNNIFKASLTIQAARPVYNSNYESPLVNFIDEFVSFRYVEYQPIEFNENRVSGNDPLVSNLTAVLAYYVYIILGMDYDSFALRAGDPYFQKALNIVNNSPDGREITGWKMSDGLRNRYFLADNLTNSRYALIHDAIYSYFRLGLDVMYDNETEGRTAIINTLNFLNNINTETPNTMGLQFFFQGRSSELIGAFKKSLPDEKSRVRELLIKLDLSSANKYSQELK